MQVANESYKYALDAAEALDQKDKQDRYTVGIYEMLSKLKARLLSRGIIQKDIKARQLSDSLFNLDKSFLTNISKTNTALLKAEQEGANARRDSLFEIYFKEVEDFNLFKAQTLAIKAQTFDFRKNKLKEIQGHLNKETAIFEYFLSEGKLAIFIVTAKSFKLITKTIDLQELEDHIQSLKIGKTIPLEFSQHILNGIDELESKINKIIIIPDHELLAFPFEALRIDDESYFIEKFEIVYEYSVDFLLAHDSKTVANTKLVALASNYESASFDVLKENIFFNPDQINLSSLNFAIEEIEYANKVLKGETWINQEATKENFINNLNTAGVIHLGLHGLLNKDFPDQSGLVFNPKEGEEVEDFLLTSAEIYNLDINPAITILSACNSGAGKLNDGDGLRSIARSFIHAGSRSILMSLWEAPDVSTNQIIQSFYDNIGEGRTMSKALQQAKLTYIEKASPSFRHPKYWSHLVLVGDAPPLGGDENMLYYLLPVLVLVIGLFYFKRKS